MNKQTNTNANNGCKMRKYIIVFSSCLFLSLNALFSQEKNNVRYQSRPLEVTKQKTNEFDEQILRKKMKADGLHDAVIDKLIEQRKEWMSQGKNIYWTSAKNANPPVVQAPCPDMGVENGWGAWQGDIGTANSGSQTWTPPPGPPTNPNFALTTGTGIDQNTPSPGNPPIPVVCPGFGSRSIRIGEICQAGCVAEQLTYPLTVTASDTNFVYAYAIVIEDAGHAVSDQPFVELCIYDQSGNPIPCGCFRYTGGPNIPGFYSVSGTGCAFTNAQYKPWTLVGVNLKNYLNQTLNVVITNVDCALCGHWAYSYWDFMCGTASLSAGCVGNQSTICGPIDPNINYTYQWYHNGNQMPPPQGTQQCITVTAQPGDTFHVEVQQPSGCNFKIGYVPASVQPSFTQTGSCGTYTFTNTSTASPASVSITGYNWSFPGGNPSSSTSPSPVVTYNTPGTYTVTLTVTVSAGCTAVTTQTINVTGLPTAQFTPSPACVGNAVTLTDASISPAGDPITNWSWSMPSGMPATGTGTLVTTTYPTAGNYTATLTVTTAQGCSSSVSLPVTVYAAPVANFSGTGTGCVPVCVNNYTDLSTSSSGNITSWQWSFPGGSPSASTSQNPGQVCYYTVGTYSTTLIVTTQYGCKDTFTMQTVTPRPWPTADFCIIPDGPVSIQDPTFTFCDLWSSDVVQWTWSFGDNDSDKVNTDPVHSYSASVTTNDFYYFNVCLHVLNQYGCWDTICKVVEIIPEFTFYIPNTFTPNGDFINDVFFGKGRGIKDYNIWIFDRWGNLIWDCHHSDKNTNWDNPGQDGLSSYCKWDGKVEKGGVDMSGGSKQLAQEDVYVWKVKLTDVFDKKHTYVGHVNIVR